MDNRDFVNPSAWDDTRDINEAPDGLVGASRYYVERPVTQFNFLLNYFNDTLFGASHDMKVGIEYADRNSYTESVSVGNAYYNWNINYPTLDLDDMLNPGFGDGIADDPSLATLSSGAANPFDARSLKYFSYFRGYYRDYGVGALALYFSDTISFGRWNLILGLRYDKQTPRLNPVSISAVTDNPAWDRLATAGVKTALDAQMPAVELDEASGFTDIKFADGSQYNWTFWSPRLGVTWDVTGDGKTIAKASFAMYGDFMGTTDYNQMPGGTGGWIDYYWWDGNGTPGSFAADEMIQPGELYWGGDGTNWGVDQPIQIPMGASTITPTANMISEAAASST